MTQTVSAVAFGRARDLAVRIFEPAYDDLSPPRRLMLNIDMQAALMVALHAMGVEVEGEACDDVDERMLEKLAEAEVTVRRVTRGAERIRD